MRITFVISSLGAGGAERVLVTLANRMKLDGFDITILTFEQADARPFFALDPGVAYRPLGIGTRKSSGLRKIPRLIALVPSLRKAIRASAPEVIVALIDQANMLTLAASIGLKTPVVVCEHNNPARVSILDPHHPAILRFILKHLRDILYRLATRVVVLTEDALSYFPAALRSKLIAIPNPVTLDTQETTDFALPPNSIIALGRLVNQKRFDLLIEGFAKIAAKFPDWQLFIFGEGALRQELEEQISKLGLSSRIKLPGTTKTAQGLLRKAEIFVLSSDHEGFPVALCEAMACGTAVIATDCPYGPGTIITDGHDGLLVPVGNSVALAQKIEKLISDAELRSRLGVEAEKVVERFSLAKIAKTWKELFRNLSPPLV